MTFCKEWNKIFSHFANTLSWKCAILLQNVRCYISVFGHMLEYR